MLENVVLRRLRSVEGRVVDAHGEPVAGATVRQCGDGPVPTETETDADGRYPAPGSPGRAGVPLRREEGLPIRRPVDRSRTPHRSSSDPGANRRTAGQSADDVAPRPFLATQERKLFLHLIFDPYADRVLHGGKSQSSDYEVFRILTRLDPERARAILDRKDSLPDLTTSLGERGGAGSSSSKATDNALNLIAAIRDPYAAVLCLREGECGRRRFQEAQSPRVAE